MNDTDWFIRREVARQQRATPRCYGISSDALALYGLGAGPRPRIPGQTTGPGMTWCGDECGDRYPTDVSDLNACERTFEMAPVEVRLRMEPVLHEFRRWVLQGVNRHGDVVPGAARPAAEQANHRPAQVEDLVRHVPGSRWRVLAQNPRLSIDHTDGGPVFDELVVDHWLHVEQLEDDFWWMSVAGVVVNVTVGADGNATAVTVYGPEDYEAPREGCEYGVVWSDADADEGGAS